MEQEQTPAISVDASLQTPPAEVSAEPVTDNTSAPVLQAQPIDSADAGPALVDELVADEFVYAAGKLRLHFPTIGLEKECEAAAQELGVAPTEYHRIFSEKTRYPGSRDSSSEAISYRPYRYIAEQVSWILTIDGQDAYVLVPQSVVELNEFINCLKVDEDDPMDNDRQIIAIGELGPMAPSDLSGDTALRMVSCKHVYPFSYKALEKELDGNSNSTTSAISSVLQLLKVRQNLGQNDFERAKNFIAYRYLDIYRLSLGQYQGGRNYDNQSSVDQEECFLADLQTRYADNTAGRELVDLIFTYQKKVSGRQYSYYLSVDTTEMFPFLHAPLSDYIPSN
ncbi:hypothetical protein [Oceanospirillum sediminis]|uniref:PatG domain-containing protein n=1 Tax=Oceanospirillum sediminis TaxID=2760088 RepID=A0A839IPX7_9GAMM|nr:hypothetical protein [Oceanospirillum sediminis]MBB1486724.1 hypothetical protein [Oceanospirillum sediminis]